MKSMFIALVVVIGFSVVSATTANAQIGFGAFGIQIPFGNSGGGISLNLGQVGGAGIGFNQGFGGGFNQFGGGFNQGFGGFGGGFNPGFGAPSDLGWGGYQRAHAMNSQNCYQGGWQGYQQPRQYYAPPQYHQHQHYYHPQPMYQYRGW